ncbi:hypothetical protein [Dactylosporangium sp. NPDC000521]|uniref:hypothetical protein n=1 Tax=Dactylosporangium sp. NPDC000521 TaxID=3363975 RepID=UPI00368ED467
MNDRTLDLLAAADPAREAPVAPGDVEALLRRAAHDVTSYEVRVPDRRRRALVAVAAGVAVAAVAGTAVAVLTGPGAGPAAPVTTPPGAVPSSVATSCLERIAGDIHAAPYDTAAGAYEYLRTWSHGGDTVQLQDGRFARAAYQVELSTWTAADGAQRRRTVVQQVTYADETSEAYFRAHPSQRQRTDPRVEDVPAGRTPVPAADPAAMADALFRPRENGPSQALVGVADLVRVRVLDAAHRAALLRFLARTDGVTCGGEATDPTGRTGVTVTAPIGKGPQPSPGDHGSELLLVDPATGDILAAGYADGTGTIWRDTFLERGFTDSRPPVTP